MATYYIRPWLSGQGNYPSDPQEGDICITESLDQAWRPVGEGDVVKTEVYSSGEWVEQSGGGGITIENAIFHSDSVEWYKEGSHYEKECELDEPIDPDNPPTALGLICDNKAYALPGDGEVFGEWSGGSPVLTNYPFAVCFDDAAVCLVFAKESTTDLTIFA